MNGIAIKDIPGALVDNQYSMKFQGHLPSPQEILDAGFINWKHRQGEVKIGLNREKLAEWSYNDMRDYLVKLGDKIIPEWKDADESWRKPHYIKADAIIANQKELFEVVK